MKKFALVGVAGYIAPRHLKAIKETGNILDVALDKCDSVGILDSFFPNCSFFTEFERFDRYVDKFRNSDNKIDFISICSPNYLHDAHIRFTLRSGANAICEKPLVLNPKNILKLMDIEKETGKKIYPILQLRLHQDIINLKKNTIEQLKKDPDKIFDIDLTYITSRGKWYYYSWKNDIVKSGGIATNIGIHFFDMLINIFGNVKTNIVHIREDNVTAGYLELEHARVRWFLSIDEAHLPEVCSKKGQRTYRSITVNNKEIEFSNGFTDLHTLSYDAILKNQGFSIEDTLSSITLVSKIRNCDIEPLKKGDAHHFCQKVLNV